MSRPARTVRTLNDANERLSRLGYQDIDQAQFDALQATLPNYWAWIDDCIAQERASIHWRSLRAAQFAAGQACRQVLHRTGVRPPLEQVILLVTARGDVRDALARLYKLPDQAAADVDLIRSAFASKPQSLQPRGSASGAETASPSDRSAWQVHKVYGARFAVAVELTRDRSGRAALQIEAAERLPQAKAWDWAGKIILQLKDPEVVELLAMLQGQAPRASFSHHGPNRDKSCELVAQPKSSNFMLAVRQGDAARAVPIPPSHAFSIRKLAIEVLRANSPGLSASDVLALAGIPFSAPAPDSRP